MKRFLRNIKFSHLLLAALAIRLILVPALAPRTDLTTNTIWGIYAREFGLRGYYDWLNFGNYARPEYPPFSTLLFLLIRIIWEGIYAALWLVNINIPAFPSGLMSWFDQFGNMALLKLPGILGDLGIGYLIYHYTKSKKLASFYLFNPAMIYLSAVWGQTEGLIGFLALWAFLMFLTKKYFLGFWGFFVSFLTKASMLPMVPVVLVQMVKDKIKLKQMAILTLFLVGGAYSVGALFTDHLPFAWMVRNYWEKFIVGPMNLPFINLNAFNFWGLILGLNPIPEAAYKVMAWGLAGVFFVLVLNRFQKKGVNAFFALLLIFFAAFLFLPRMHERYLYPIFIFFPLVLAKWPRLSKVFFLLSAIFLLNLYHGWWFPEIPPLMALLDLELVERGLSLVNLVGFGYLFYEYLS